MLSAESVDHWEQAWQATDDGNHTRSIFPTIADRMRTSFPFSWRMTMLLSGHGRLRAYLHRFYLAETDFCSCGSGDVQDWSHVLYDCSHFVVPRARLERTCVLQGNEWPCDVIVLLQRYKRDLCLFLEAINFDLL